MTTSYSIEKIAASNRRDALNAAEARRLARALRATRCTQVEPQPDSPATGTIRVPRRRRWFGVAAAQ